MEGARTGEAEIAEAVLRILDGMPNGEATIAQLKKRIPTEISLTPGDRQQSVTRRNEELWEQLVRNIVSHKNSEGNIVAEGLANTPSRGKLRITAAGRLHVANRR
jgi:restriction endonuclease Mrr